jgi:ferric-dicitrate binding protein FerR (iron transport regulator)
MSEWGPEAHHVAQAQAIAWCIRLRDGTGDDWAAFVRWLEVDPAHLVAYDEIAVADQDISAAAFSKSPSIDRERGESGWNAPLRGRASQRPAL